MISIGHLSVQQERGRLSSIVNGAYDVVIAVAGWDTRSIACADVAVSAKECILMTFRNPGESGRSEENVRRLEEWMALVSGKMPSVYEFDSLDVYSSQSVAEGIARGVLEKCPSGRILVDMSVFPKAHFSQFIAIMLRSAAGREIHVLYSIAEYEFDEEKSVKAVDSGHVVLTPETALQYRYTDGGWVPVVIPYLEGGLNLTGKRHVCISIGSEALHASQLLSQYDPDIVTMISPVPGFSDVLTELVERQADYIDGAFKDRILTRINFPVWDVEGLFKGIVEFYNSGNKIFVDDVTFMLCGSKPHGLALTLAALSLGEATVVCRVPRGYSEKDSRPTGKACLYKLTNLLRL